MHNPESNLENETQNFLRHFEIQTDHLISARQRDQERVNKRKKKKKRICRILDFAVPADQRLKLKKSEKKDKYLDLARERKNNGT